jgi:ligand-binding sensor domain-containing protein
MAVLVLVTAGTFREATAAAPMRFERLGIDAGLSQQAVLAIAQDSTGFMWFGTEDGLDRFDGYSFQHLRQAYAGARGLTDVFVTDVQFDRSGRLWVATDGGAVVWRDPLEREFHSILAGASEQSIHGLEYVRVIRFDHDGRLWIGTREGGVALFDPKDRRLVRLRHKAADAGSLGDDSVFALLQDQHGAIWVGTQTGLDRLDLESGKFKHLTPDPGHAVHVRALLEERGKLWIGTDTGLWQLDPASGAQTVFHHDAADGRSLPADQVSALYLDSGERLWAGTQGGGLNVLDPVSGRFFHLKHDARNPRSAAPTATTPSIRPVSCLIPRRPRWC